MFEELILLLGNVIQKVPDYPRLALATFRTFENGDTHDLFLLLIWLPINAYIFIRLLQPSLHNEREPSRITYCLFALVVWLFWAYFNFVANVINPAKFTQNLHTNFIAVKCFTIYVQCLLLVKITNLIFHLYRLTFFMHKVSDVIFCIFKEENLKLILSTKTLMRYLIGYMLLEALYEFVNPHEDYVVSGLITWSFMTIPLLIGCFLIAKNALSRRHQSLFIEVFSGQDDYAGKSLEETLSLVASKRMSTQLIVNEIFMDQIFKLVTAAIVTYATNHFLS